MSNDDGRGENGRWKKGHCPNPNGRPRKKAEISDADVHHFMTTTVKATINGELRSVTRQELLLHKMYEQAIKGSVTMQKKLFERFEASEETFAQLRMVYKDVSGQILDSYYKTGTFDDKLYDEYRELRYFITGGNPDRPAPKRRKPRSKQKAAVAPAWRKGPRPQSLIDLERREDEEAERAFDAQHGDRGNDHDDD